MLQTVVVIALVLVAVVYSAWRLAPSRRRLWLIDRLPASVRGSALIARLRSKAVAEIASGCGACAAASPKQHRRAPR